MSWKAKYVILEALLVTGEAERKLVHEDVFTDEGSDPSAFFVPGVSKEHRKIGVVGLSLEEDHTGRLDYSGALPDIWVEGHE